MKPLARDDWHFALRLLAALAVLAAFILAIHLATDPITARRWPGTSLCPARSHEGEEATGAWTDTGTAGSAGRRTYRPTRAAGSAPIEGKTPSPLENRKEPASP